MSADIIVDREVAEFQRNATDLHAATGKLLAACEAEQPSEEPTEA